MGIVSLMLTAISIWPDNSKNPKQISLNNLQVDPNLTSHRIALVVGIENYDFLPAKKNSLTSSREIERALEKLNFQVIACPDDPSKNTIIRCIHDFQKILGLGGVGVFYFGGHGIQINGNNYLFARDAPLFLGLAEVEFSAINVDLLLSPVDKIIKNQPNNSGNILVYSMACSSGEENNISPFVKNFLPLLQKSNLEFSDLFQELRMAVQEQTNNKQVPWMSASFESSFQFRPSEKEDIGVLKMLVFDACRSQDRSFQMR